MKKLTNLLPVVAIVSVLTLFLFSGCGPANTDNHDVLTYVNPETGISSPVLYERGEVFTVNTCERVPTSWLNCKDELQSGFRPIYGDTTIVTLGDKWNLRGYLNMGPLDSLFVKYNAAQEQTIYSPSVGNGDESEVVESSEDETDWSSWKTLKEFVLEWLLPILLGIAALILAWRFLNWIWPSGTSTRRRTMEDDGRRVPHTVVHDHTHTVINHGPQTHQSIVEFQQGKGKTMMKFTVRGASFPLEVSIPSDTDGGKEKIFRFGPPQEKKVDDLPADTAKD